MESKEQEITNIIRENENSEGVSYQEILKFFIKKGFLLDEDLIFLFSKFSDRIIAEEILNKISSVFKTRLITKEMLFSQAIELKPLFFGLEKHDKLLLDDFFSKSSISKKEVKQEKPKIIFADKPVFKILSSNIIPFRKISVGDFITHFKNRYNSIRDILKNREELNNLVSINKIGSNTNLSVIGLISNKRITKNKNLLLEIEDPTGRINAIISQNKPELLEKSKEILLDDIIGLKCSGGKDFLFVNDIFFPEAGLPEKKKSDEEVYVLFTSDMHVGSKNFLEDNFAKFINWLNGVGCDDEQKEKIKKIKYLFIVGDTVDGVGIFPGQEELLKIKDMREQYEKLAFYLNQVPKNISIIMCPGQHDAVRVPEPQPPIDKEFAESLTQIENLFLVSNPACIEIECTKNKEGFKVLMYHGASLHDWINEIDVLRYSNAHLTPAKAVKYLLKHRHLSPTHSATTYVPSEKEDMLFIKNIPDIITTGEVHKTDIDIYNNILIICNSCWQSTTAYEEKVGNRPDPCKVPMLNLKTRELKILDFS